MKIATFVLSLLSVSGQTTDGTSPDERFVHAWYFIVGIIFAAQTSTGRPEIKVDSQIRLKVSYNI